MGFETGIGLKGGLDGLLHTSMINPIWFFKHTFRLSGGFGLSGNNSISWFFKSKTKEKYSDTNKLIKKSKGFKMS